MAIHTRRVALITGCGKRDGIGQEIARRLAGDGFTLVVVDRELAGVPNAGESQTAAGSGLTALAEELELAGVRVTPLTCDIGDPVQVSELFAAVESEYGRLDVLVNNAAAPQGPDRVDVAEVELGAWLEVIRVNLTGTFLMSQAAIALMRKGRYGRIVSISSKAAVSAAPKSAAYSASKAGVLGLTRALSMDVARWGITVNAVCPGLVGTSRSMLSNRSGDREEVLSRWADNIAVGKVGMPSDIANVVAFLADARTHHVTGQVLEVDGGGHAAFPLNSPEDSAGR